MILGDRDMRKLDRILDRFASRLGIVTAVGLLIAICAGAAVYLHTVNQQLEVTHSTFRDRQSRNGYVAMSDIQRLVLVAQRAVDQGDMTDELAREFRNATDVLFVRTDNFKRSMSDTSHLPSGIASVAALQRIVEIADKARETGYPDNRALVGDLLDGATDARGHLVQFLDDMRRQAEDVLEKQSRAVREQKVVLLLSLAALTVSSTGALLLLRREVLGRRAREHAEKRVAFLAYFDPLTELPNRAQFQDRLQKQLDARGPLSLFYVDLDGFKLINDTYGHLAGDTVLRHIGALLSEMAQDVDGFAARLGGDEFALVVPGDDLDSLTELCEDILEQTRDPFMFEGESFEVGVSIGLATTTHLALNTHVTLDMLSRVTDFALYASKAAGRRQFTVYDQALEKRFKERRALLEELPQAIERGDLDVHLQPKVRLHDGLPYGFEALVRWRRGDQLVPPDQFILIAEESGLVVDIDHFVLRQATRSVSAWNARHGTLFSISVNLSALHFSSLRIIEWVQDALWEANLDPSLLTLEITESMEMRDWKQARRIIKGLHETGCRISIDDFGTGFSSLAYLRTTSADELKIDRSLVTELESSEKARLLLSSVLDIARNLELSVVVEGIETAEQSKILQGMGARLGQGFHFGRPLPAREALAVTMRRLDQRAKALKG